VFVVAIAQASAGLHHAIADNHAIEGLVGFGMAFFGIWWAWVNFTWFASAYDCDDVPYRLLVFLQLTGALIFAAGVSALAEQHLLVAVIGYVVMRVALVLQWSRAAASDPVRRTTALRYARGVTVVQGGWVALLFVPPTWILPGFVGLMVAELAVPAWAEAAEPTPWHAGHIAERYGLLTIIVLGESILAATLAIQAALAGGETLWSLVPTIGGGLLILYSMWWFYFDRPVHDLLNSGRSAFVWGYAHFLVFASAAAVGAGLAVMTDVLTDHAEASMQTAAWAVAIPVAVYLLCLWFLHHRPRKDDVTAGGTTISAVGLVLLTPFTPSPVLATGLVLAGVLAVKLQARNRVATGEGR
jgi:low temperature requirement protein LtrA